MIKRAILVGLMACVSGAALAQIALPSLGPVTGRVEGLVNRVESLPADAMRRLEDLRDSRIERLNAFARHNRHDVELDDAGQPARAHEVLVLDPPGDSVARASAAGFAVIETEAIAGLDVRYVRLRAPAGEPLAKALGRLRALLPGATISADQIHFQGGAAGSGAGVPAPLPAVRGGTVGIIDGGAAPGARVIAQAGFARGAPRPDSHAQAIVSLLAGAGVEHLRVADVYGTDPAGGNAAAIARALGWMVGEHVPVVSISLVGPANPLLERAVAASRAHGTQVVAAVGNDGAAAPPAYPASYAGVIAVTGVDRHDRVLFEAGHATHLDYAAPGADLAAIGLDRRVIGVRGTSFAAPLAAARLAAWRASGSDPAGALAEADREARAPGPKVGRGILCDTCRKGI